MEDSKKVMLENAYYRHALRTTLKQLNHLVSHPHRNGVSASDLASVMNYIGIVLDDHRETNAARVERKLTTLERIASETRLNVTAELLIELDKES